MAIMLPTLGLFSACNKLDDVTDINNHSEKEEASTITKNSGEMVKFQIQNIDGKCFNFIGSLFAHKKIIINTLQPCRLLSSGIFS